jgi:hypothetical protein
MLMVGTMSAFMNNIGAVAILLPTMFVIAQRSNYPVTKLLIAALFRFVARRFDDSHRHPPKSPLFHGARGSRLPRIPDVRLFCQRAAVMITGAFYMALVGRHLIPTRNRAKA